MGQLWLESQHYSKVIEHMVAAGLGISVVPRYAVADAVRAGRLHAASAFGSSHLRRLSLVRRKGKGNTNPAAQAMAQLLEQTLDADSLL